MAITVGLSSFLICFTAWRHLSPSGILFYQGVACCIIATSVTLLLSIRRSPRQVATICKDAALVFLAAYSFMFTIPTTVERSYTVKMLLELDRRRVVGRVDMLKWIEAHWRTPDGLSKRLREQEVSGSIESTEQGLRLTSRGKWLVKAFNVTSEVFKTNRGAK